MPSINVIDGIRGNENLS